MKRLVTAASGLLVLLSVLTSPASATQPASVPTKATLTENTEVYDAPDLGSHIAAVLSPQVVTIKGMEGQWRNKTINGRHDPIWFRISTWLGDKWVLLSQDTFFGEEQERYTRVYLTGKEELLDAPNSSRRTGAVVSAQTVNITAVAGMYLKADTWLGPKWILPSHPVVFDVLEEKMTLQLPSVTPLYDTADASEEPAAELAPQAVQTLLNAPGGWYLIETSWLGPKWLNRAVAQPQNAVKETGTVKLQEQRSLYQYPNAESQVIGALAPQMITYFEKANGWVHIHSWLGDAWVLPAVESSAYTPPAQVSAVSVQGEWSEHQYDKGSVGFRGYPLAPSAGSSLKDMTRQNPDGSYPLSAPLTLSMNITNASDKTLAVRGNPQFEIEVLRVTGTTREPVWRGKLPGWPDNSLAPLAAKMFTFEWNQQDASGKQVPPGEYVVQLKLPVDVQYAAEGEQQQNTEKFEYSIRTQSGFTIK